MSKKFVTSGFQSGRREFKDNQASGKFLFRYHPHTIEAARGRIRIADGNDRAGAGNIRDQKIPGIRRSKIIQILNEISFSG